MVVCGQRLIPLKGEDIIVKMDNTTELATASDYSGTTHCGDFVQLPPAWSGYLGTPSSGTVTTTGSLGYQYQLQQMQGLQQTGFYSTPAPRGYILCRRCALKEGYIW